jgi:hypothetical protein
VKIFRKEKGFNEKIVFVCLMVFNATLLTTDQWLSSGPLVSSTNKTDHLDITEILLKVALNTIKQTKTIFNNKSKHQYVDGFP